MTDISIIMPVFNAADTLNQCLRSIQDQTFKNYEVVVIDDGSTDDSVGIIQQHQQTDSRIKLHQNSKKGLVSSLNDGLQHSNSFIIARMDADDIMHPQRLELQYNYLADSPDTGLIASQVQLFPEKDIKKGYQEYMHWQNSCLTHTQISSQIYIESPFAHPSVMFRKAIINQTGYYRDGEFPEDYDLWLRMYIAGIKMEKLELSLLKWRDSSGRTSRIDTRYSKNAFDQLRAKYLAIDKRIPTDRPLVFWGAGRKTRLRAQLLIKQGFPPSAWIDVDPKKIGNIIHSARVHPPEWLHQYNKPFVLNYVNNYGAREKIEKFMETCGYRQDEDYLMIG